MPHGGARCVHQDVEIAHLLYGTSHEFLEIGHGGRSEIARQVQETSAECLHLSGGILAGSAGNADDVGARLREPESHSLAQAAAGPRDHGYPAVQIELVQDHGLPLLLCAAVRSVRERIVRHSIRAILSWQSAQCSSRGCLSTHLPSRAASCIMTVAGRDCGASLRRARGAFFTIDI